MKRGMIMKYEELEAFFRSLDRSQFLEDEFRDYAYVDRPLPIGFEQTISQPSLVLMMTAHLRPEKDNKVLEIGTGSGYQTCILAEFSKEVFTIERISDLTVKAQERLKKMGYGNIHFRTGDGSLGWPEEAPFDRIMVTAAAASLPFELISQLKEGGLMLIPVGPQDFQELQLIRKKKDGTFEVETVEMVRFVEMKGKYGWNKK
ncbi:protein-L-isoaspartate(D-aspartate) O-methyltransferase [Proteiniclasticum sp.]|uniref:protein-L-isoaspartate(D-aspartate) O-methyltransferase n=1 Tax=Proteiniclasticum sp. TaxID=2053595 RepID=UPI0028A153CE|nr:protein-L-isoaspartate(D-aspartate) O-methyltransferase [Proteiniclasticum sp.]